MNYIELNIEFKTLEPWREVVMTELAENGFESFVDTKLGLNAYIKEEGYALNVTEILAPFSAQIEHFHEKEIVDENWNAAWESNFDPVFVGEQLAILAPFHEDDGSRELVIRIQPQMSFGTGHHQTTWLASQKMLSLDLKGKKVLDMGTGTGVLAVLAEKLGAIEIFAPDIDTWAFENAKENCTLNQTKHVEVALGGAELLKNMAFDLIIANINKNILLDQIATYAKVAAPNATLLMSGFFSTDAPDLIEHANKFGFIFEKAYHKDEWALLNFKKI
ncbi:50S ribosomal protein L11 methyltransferase [Putridiphycobacter roseus]|uniref:Ribosomal protein L11 methyltransferase n=1 Tax=Putridiphycobacter roseus TaxID=2219161 RepID=A0A2W1NIK2_9FLAO|nr:50S ribosomal protein L11 methyltransferase [Putridiphycobacter roseus]PZE17756.1 50S ribosomal protein L11 methyltransferase [Putridiphycobacter roseus]